MSLIPINILTYKELRFALLFLFTFCVLHYAYSSSRDGLVEHFVIDVATVCPSAAIINLIDPEESYGQRPAHRFSSRFRYDTQWCEGTETVFLLIAALAAFQASWKNRLKGYCWARAWSIALIRLASLPCFSLPTKTADGST